MKCRKVKNTLIYLILLVFVLSSSGCSVVNSLNIFNGENKRGSGEIGENGYLNMYDLVQKLADSLRNENEIENIFGSIPQRQRDGLTLDQYQQYVKLLKRGITGEITSFAMMNDNELAGQREKMLANQPERQGLIETMQGAWLIYREIGRSETKFAIYVSLHEEGFYTIGGQWVAEILALYDLARLYFDAIESANQQALAVLIRTDDRPGDILEAKADKIISFYRNNISSRTAEFILTSARMDSISFEQFGITNPDQTQSVSRSIEIISTSGENYLIDDVIPDIINPIDLDIYFNEQQIIQFAAMEENEPAIVRSNNLESIIGEPLIHDDSNCVNLAGGSQRMTLEYTNLQLIAEGSCFRHSRWEGQVRQLLLLDEMTELGSGISPGDSVYDVLRQYPFADKTGFLINRRSEAGNISLQFIVEDEVIQAIELKLSAY